MKLKTWTNVIFCVMLAAVTLTGCTTQKKKIKVLADPPLPLGTQLKEIQDLQVENAEAAKYVIHEHEFVRPEMLAESVDGG